VRLIDLSATAADESNVSPAADVPAGVQMTGYESLQLTDDVLANLTDLQLSNISLFYFDDASDAEKRSVVSGPQCKVLPGDLFYPNKVLWKLLDILSGGALIKTVPLGSACYQGEHYDEAKCEFLVNNWNDSDTQ
jgi:hypothetical protein